MHLFHQQWKLRSLLLFACKVRAHDDPRALLDDVARIACWRKAELRYDRVQDDFRLDEREPISNTCVGAIDERQERTPHAWDSLDHIRDARNPAVGTVVDIASVSEQEGTRE
jgi:hypothetical protein